MNSIYIFCFLLFALFFLACKQNSSTPIEETVQQVPRESAQTQASEVTETMVKHDTTSGHDYTFLTDKLFLFKDAIGGSKEAKEKPFKDEWIDLESNGTFKAGKLKEQTHTGQWSYNHDTKTLFLRPDTSKFKMSEWKVLFNDQMMIWIGTQTYHNNPLQLKLIRSNVLP